MKKIVLLSIIFSGFMSGQLAIGKSSVSNDSVSLEFGNENRGLILPWVTSADNVAGVVNGTLIYDSNDKKVKVKYNTGWKDLSLQTGTVDLALQSSKTEQTDAKTVIGAGSSSAPGILVLEDTTRAMILPKVSQPYNNIINPAAGMIVYDTNKKLLAVFNGSVWSFWGAAN